jgi:hypothetical protein
LHEGQQYHHRARVDDRPHLFDAGDAAPPRHAAYTRALLRLCNRADTDIGSQLYISAEIA